MASTPLASWRAFEDNEITHSGAHYLLAISSLARSGAAPRAADVARQLGVTRAAASLQLRALQEHGLVRLDVRQRLRLTRPGADLVGRIASKREILLVFLREVMGVREATAELDACKIEHLLSEETGAALVRLVRFLRSGRPEARKFVSAFRRATAECPPGARCDLCAQACLLAVASGSSSV
ncbi:MAG TPA: metal-dependent transcriptional regulator [Thermoanaerobaculaceae bacterium]|nr:metal-dependent transcriptional regulator [Thermoanaerobaculaceae bacterium]